MPSKFLDSSNAWSRILTAILFSFFLKYSKNQEKWKNKIIVYFFSMIPKHNSCFKYKMKNSSKRNNNDFLFTVSNPLLISKFKLFSEFSLLWWWSNPCITTSSFVSSNESFYSDLSSCFFFPSKFLPLAVLMRTFRVSSFEFNKIIRFL